MRKFILLLVLIGLVGCCSCDDSKEDVSYKTGTILPGNAIFISSSSEESVNDQVIAKYGTGYVPRLKYGDKVRITGGFYYGQEAEIFDYRLDDGKYFLTNPISDWVDPAFFEKV